VYGLSLSLYTGYSLTVFSKGWGCLLASEFEGEVFGQGLEGGGHAALDHCVVYLPEIAQQIPSYAIRSCFPFLYSITVTRFQESK